MLRVRSELVLQDGSIHAVGGEIERGETAICERCRAAVKKHLQEALDTIPAEQAKDVPLSALLGEPPTSEAR